MEPTLTPPTPRGPRPLTLDATAPHVMLDIETMGQRPGAAIVALGAVRFSAAGIEAEFYERIDLASCIGCGLVIEPATVLWWMRQSDEARAELAGPGLPLEAALDRFIRWLGGSEVRVWGNGAGFDCALVAEAYARIGRPVPWKFWNERCYRTIKADWPQVPMRREGTHHHALDDARDQARHLIAIWAARDARN